MDRLRTAGGTQKLVSAVEAISYIGPDDTVLLIGAHESSCLLYTLLKEGRQGMKVYDYRDATSASILQLLSAGENCYPEEIPSEILAEQLRAGAKDTEYVSVDVPASTVLKHRDLFRSVVSPFSERMTTMGRAIRPDVALIHVARADVYGNVQIDPAEDINGIEELRMALAADRIIVSAEQIVTDKSIEMNRRNTVFAGNKVICVVEAPYGGYPFESGCRYQADRNPEKVFIEALKRYDSWEQWIGSVGIDLLLCGTVNRRGE